MFTFLTVLIIVVCLFIILIVLVQNPKGGGLSGGIGSAASNVIGVQSAGDVMEKTTWGSALVLLVLCVLTAFVVPKEGAADKVKTITESAAKMNVPAAPAAPAQPAQQPASNPLTPQQPAK